MQKEIAPPMPLTQAKVVGTDYDGQRLDNYLAREMKGAPRRLIYRIIRTGQVRINSRRAEHCTRLQTGDVLRIPDNIRTYFSTAQAAPLALPVLFEDGALLAVNKPSGLAVHGGSGLSHGVIERLRATHSGRFLELVHRIDKGTSGVLLLAKKNSALRSLHAAWRARQVKKRYNLMVFGQWQPQAAVIQHQPAHDPDNIRMRS
jgi:23S rRNA pseudouridine955/2504/2580 synthase